LIGSVIIVLHAPADEQIDRIDEMLNFALQPGLLLPHSPAAARAVAAADIVACYRLPILRLLRYCILAHNDLQGFACIRQKEPASLHFDLQHGWIVDGA
jgi:hypothetical protein